MRVLAGTPPRDLAQDALLDTQDLAEAAAIYQQAGQHALNQHTGSGWWQVYVQFPDWNTAEQTAIDHLAPLLDRAVRDGTVTRFWFMRKHPYWRLRLQPGPAAHDTRRALSAAFDQLTAAGQLAGWRTGIYEAETAAFGGDTGVDIAHDLFCHDSHAILRLLADGPRLGRRELSLLLCATLLRAAGLEHYEQGDAWHRVARERPLPADVPATKLAALADDLHQLLLADTTPGGPLLVADGPLATVPGWAYAFHQAGQKLGAANRAGTLHRGLRETLSYLVIFHWNRLGLPTRTQSILASAARIAILGAPGPTTARPDQRPAVRATPLRLTTGDDPATSQAFARFPLVLRRGVHCADLETRVRDVHDCAHTAHQAASPTDRLNRACTAYNLAALIATDCGLPTLAADLCHQQFQIFHAARPLTGPAALAALQPLVNLTRLARRSGDLAAAYQALNDLHRALETGGDAEIDGMRIPLDGLIATDDDRIETTRWLHTVLRDDGTRALAAGGRWQEAADHAARYDDVGHQLRQARQTRIIAHTLAGRPDVALALLDTSALHQPWEHAVASCLRGHLLRTASPPGDADLAAVEHALETSDQTTTLFHLRVGLTAIDLFMQTCPDDADRLLTRLVDKTSQAADAYAARELLDHPASQHRLTPNQTATLTTLVHRAHLNAGAIPDPLREDLTASLATTRSALRQVLVVT
ncbi:thiopeptide-type bacteriocin biosynthesis protein [Pseudofrankia sp. BMG5.37]|uniref:thiopeptide-type bacteriocin biosynthesis protein n=1 Tax=Pseudofrankia sp. BMG5.37 TaxID=3050035 RepID=UPI0028958A4D|nr:thiopeptide-type bacteriocin biosynthesis protein [Pseudofrankia sp. BMG5.37]MDT3444484.1 thiopeptide-type bacteriocin biosynthesis protein [Pseudofrankia sp. BMG5.37]